MVRRLVSAPGPQKSGRFHVVAHVTPDHDRERIEQRNAIRLVILAALWTTAVFALIGTLVWWAR